MRQGRGTKDLTFFRPKLYLLSCDDQAHQLSFLSQTSHFQAYQLSDHTSKRTQSFPTWLLSNVC